MKIPIILVFTLAIFSAYGDDDPKHSHDHDHNHSHHGGDDHAHAPGHHATIVVSEDSAEIWSRINAYSKVVNQAANKGDIDTLHKEQLNLEALIGGLAKGVSTLDEAKQERVEGMINNVQRALGQLHTATDAKDQASIKKHAKSLSGVLALLKAQYPKEMTAGLGLVKDDIGPHQGMLAEIKDSSGKSVGNIELKLHDDKGDLELWLPLDIDANSTITVNFTDAKKASAILAVRNMAKNEDEGGNATMRDGKTNYFIYPGASGESADWLQGKQFKSNVTLSFKEGVAEYTSGSFLLIPHGH